MTPKQFKVLKRGDIVRHFEESVSYIVMANYGDRITAARTVDMTNPREWQVIDPETGNPKPNAPADIDTVKP